MWATKVTRRLPASAFLLLSGILLVAGGCATARPIDYKINANYTVADPQFQQTMGALLGTSMLGGNRVTTLMNGDQIFPSMLEAIRSAKKTITFETYVYWTGTIGQEFADAIAERARAGVKALVVVDWFGGSKMKPELIREMTDAGARVVKYHPFNIFDPGTWGELNHRTHRKILVVDGKIGFTGGVGIADEWRGNGDAPDHWRDNHYKVDGPVVGQLQAVFADDWMQCTGEVLTGNDYFPKLVPVGDQWCQSFMSGWTGGSENIELMFLLSVAAAGSNIRMESAYFVPDPLTRKYLIAARRRGVSVQIIVPGPHIDEQFVRHASRAHWGELLKAGIEIYVFQPTMLHCKLTMVDDLWVSIGSSNMDNRSFRLNEEANLNVYDHSFAQEQIRVFEQDKTRCKRVTYENWARRPLAEKITDALSSALDWQL